MRTSSKLVKSAKRYADHQARIDKFVHSRSGSKYRRKGVGENLALDGGSKSCAEMAKYAMDRYYDEGKLFDFNRGGFNMKTSHFTQILWKDTTELGCAISFKSRKGWYYGVCHYSPYYYSKKNQILHKTSCLMFSVHSQNSFLEILIIHKTVKSVYSLGTS